MAHWTNDRVLRAWVDHNQRGAERASARTHHFMFRGPILFSYGDPLACYHTGPTARLFVLLPRQRIKAGAGWGNRSHWAEAYSAVGTPKFRVANINIEGSPKVHEANLLQMYADFKQAEDELIGNFKKWEGRVSDTEVWSLRQDHESISHYIACAGIDSEPPDIEQRIEHVRYERMKRWYQYMDPKMVAKRERAAARKLARELLGV
jgi:hypothetical protein